MAPRRKKRRWEDKTTKDSFYTWITNLRQRKTQIECTTMWHLKYVMSSCRSGWRWTDMLNLVAVLLSAYD
jgi:hypothetical protein